MLRNCCPPRCCCWASSTTTLSTSACSTQPQWLAIRNPVGVVVLEMAERGTSTAALPVDATPAQVQNALRWNDAVPALGRLPGHHGSRAGWGAGAGGRLPRTQNRAARCAMTPLIWSLTPPV